MEKILGSKTDKFFINTYLKDIRKKRLDSFSDSKDYSSLKLLTLTNSNHIFFNLLKQLIYDKSLCKKEKRVFNKIKLIDLDKYFIKKIVNLSTDPGGFHSQNPGGYRYVEDYAFCTEPNENVINSNILANLDLLRCYIHDSVHSSTFRTFKSVPQYDTSAHPWPIYRERYGFNIRKSSGISYSSIKYTDESPFRINLNLLMDGITVLITSYIMRNIIISNIKNINFDKNIIMDLLAIPDQIQITHSSYKFHQDVTKPSKLFLDYWGGEKLMFILFDSMISGNIKYAQEYFNLKLKMNAAWEYLFKSPTWINNE